MSEDLYDSCVPARSQTATAARRRFGIRLPLLAIAWATTIFTGMLISIDFQSRPGLSGSAPGRWPEKVPIAAPTTKPLLLLFLHPHCPCSRVSLGVLNELLLASPIPVRAQVIFFASRQFAEPVEKSESWQQAHQLKGVTVVCDSGGCLARRFGAQASGWVVVYDSTGQLQFEGGITAGRGHAGANPGSEAIASLLKGQTVVNRSHCVFGCPIVSQSSGGEGIVR